MRKASKIPLAASASVGLGRLEGGDPSLDVGRLGQEASEQLEVRYCRVLEIAKVGNDRVEDFDEGRCV
jgi:hypothetical protein